MFRLVSVALLILINVRVNDDIKGRERFYNTCYQYLLYYNNANVPRNPASSGPWVAGWPGVCWLLWIEERVLPCWCCPAWLRLSSHPLQSVSQNRRPVLSQSSSPGKKKNYLKHVMTFWFGRMARYKLHYMQSFNILPFECIERASYWRVTLHKYSADLGCIVYAEYVLVHSRTYCHP